MDLGSVMCLFVLSAGSQLAMTGPGVFRLKAIQSNATISKAMPPFGCTPREGDYLQFLILLKRGLLSSKYQVRRPLPVYLL